jgi:hypothetical protein
MSIMIANYEFEGPFHSLDKIKNQSGVFGVILQTQNELFLLDAGESEKVKSKIESHERKNIWEKYSSQGKLLYTTCYVEADDDKDRKKILNEINKIYKTPFNKD